MKSLLISLLKSLWVALLITSALVAADSQTAPTGGRIRIDNLDGLAAKAAESANINLDERLLRLVPPILGKDPDDKELKTLIAKLKGVYVRQFEFDNTGAYTESDVAPVREQLRSPDWARVAEVVSRREGTNVEVYIMTQGGQVGGLVIISSEPKELTVVNIVGAVDIDKLSKLEGQFGVPDLEIERPAKQPQKKP